jgi:ankyrin repeat protein
VDEQMNTLLHDATSRGDIDQVAVLLQAGANIDDLDKYNQTPVMNAARLGHVGLVRFLTARGAALDSTAKYNHTALMDAIICYQEEAAVILIEAGADSTIRGGKANPYYSGKTALDLAKEREQEQVVALLEQHGG